jgi:RNA-directed DNA polymerase
MSSKRQNNQMHLAFPAESRSEAPTADGQGTELSVAKQASERPVDPNTQLMEAICERTNLIEAYNRVLSNQGAPGVDGMTVEHLGAHLRTHWPTIREQLRQGTYTPQPVRRVEIPKPGGGQRQLGIPTVVDRLIQQAILQVLNKQWDESFSKHSYGFRPGRSAHQALAAAQQHIADGFRWVVDIDLEKFFDRVNHDVLMSRVARRVADKRVLKLLRAFLNAGVMENGLVSPTDEGTPQGGPLSPLLSNLLLDELDRELEDRGLRFVRYADDCNIYVRSERAGQRVKASVTQWLAKRLRLTVNESKSAVARPWERKFLGFSFTPQVVPRRRIAPQSIERFKRKIRALTYRTRGIGIEQLVKGLAVYLRGWNAYFGYCQTPSVLRDLESWLRRRLRSYLWKQWKRGSKRYQELRDRGVGRSLAAQTAGSSDGPWHLARSPALAIALPDRWFDRIGLPRLRVMAK